MKRLIVLFLALTVVSVSAQGKFKRTMKLQFELTGFSLTENGEKIESRVFSPGQKVWIGLKVRGVQKDDKKNVNFQADLLLKTDGMKIVLDKKNILNQSLHAGDITPVVNTTYNIDLGQEIQPGKYHVEITFRDLSSGQYNKYNTWFIVQGDTGM